jgi:hypothetical protein
MTKLIIDDFETLSDKDKVLVIKYLQSKNLFIRFKG